MATTSLAWTPRPPCPVPFAEYSIDVLSTALPGGSTDLEVEALVMDLTCVCRVVCWVALPHRRPRLHPPTVCHRGVHRPSYHSDTVAAEAVLDRLCCVNPSGRDFVSAVRGLQGDPDGTSVARFAAKLLDAYKARSKYVLRKLAYVKVMQYVRAKHNIHIDAKVDATVKEDFLRRDLQIRQSVVLHMDENKLTIAASVALLTALCRLDPAVQFVWY